ncbi:hypothetical protein K4L06_03725 [Lysobacter sp. BMK333-48F3]|uniref:hypothetical protein n=1 Tax=Lysobacter sp. BMK333-48F3 TaxID=2867962 RepID=UPI001C8C35DB|nr:hypothetical protein [Lysobacter sp. BMK333-48F3]MBX9400407.1 hypothetical protein [Lysobacter sp. BMK333-48F3]
MTRPEREPKRRLRPVRLFAGVLCLLLGLTLMLLLGLGVLGPGAGVGGAPALIALMPSVAIGATVFALGLWLVATGRGR